MPPPTHGISRDCTPGLPGGTSELNSILGPLRMSVQRPNKAERLGSSNLSTKTTRGSFSMPTSPGYSAAIPAPGSVPEKRRNPVGAPGACWVAATVLASGLVSGLRTAVAAAGAAERKAARTPAKTIPALDRIDANIGVCSRSRSYVPIAETLCARLHRARLHCARLHCARLHWHRSEHSHFVDIRKLAIRKPVGPLRALPLQYGRAGPDKVRVGQTKGQPSSVKRRPDPALD